jgi:hypothetical protein
MSEPTDQKQPLLLRGRLRELPASKPSRGTVYDERRQLWLDDKGTPVVSKQTSASDFGETSRTDSHEGVDQSEISNGIFASDFGETTVTKTSEGQDVTEVFQSSDFGETSHTRTTEGVDTSEGSDITSGLSPASDFGETTKTATQEGSDQTEVS